MISRQDTVTDKLGGQIPITQHAVTEDDWTTPQAVTRISKHIHTLTGSIHHSSVDPPSWLDYAVPRASRDSILNVKIYTFHFRLHRTVSNFFFMCYPLLWRCYAYYLCTCITSPIVNITVMYSRTLSLRPFLLPTFEPLAHLSSGGFAADVHRGDHLLPLDREREAGEFEERAVF